jgi:DNA-directed RNA polymerase subunit P
VKALITSSLLLMPRSIDMSSGRSGEEGGPAGGPYYECINCGTKVEYRELERYITFKCPQCGYRIFRKVRPPIIKRVKAR